MSCMGRPKGSKNGVRKEFEKVCETCGKTFTIQPYQLKTARFCSRACQHIGHSIELTKPPVEHICENCGKHFVTDSRKQKDNRTCSQKCGYELTHQKSRGLRTDRLDVTCAWCGKVFQARSAEHKVFCSRDCANKAMRRTVDLVCQECGKTFTVRAKLTERKYCSRTCRNIGIGKTMTCIEKAMLEVFEREHIVYEKQYPIGPFTADFAFPDKHVVVECDGKYWHSLEDVQKRDRKKDNYLRRNGWHIVRLSEDEINTNLSQCLLRVEEALSR